MTIDQIKALQSRIGATPDGHWGPRSIEQCKRHLLALMPWPRSWPTSDQRGLSIFYGEPGDESRLVAIDVRGLGVEFDGAPCATVRCNRACAESLERVLRQLHAKHPAILKKYAGCVNNRVMRGGSLPSLHARGAAIDFWPETNGNLTHWPTAAEMPIEIMEEFAREGWISAGAFWGRDAMHFQATR